MTEAEWFCSTAPYEMLIAAKSRFRHRKLRLFAVACARLIQPMLPDARSHHAIDVAEQFADGQVDEADLTAARHVASLAHKQAFSERGKAGACLEWAAEYAAAIPAIFAARNVSWMSATGRQGEATPATYTVQAAIVRDTLGNPFRPVTLAASWMTDEVGALARGTYDQHAFERLPELADVLEQAGCHDGDVLSHCRGPGPHVRGCWVIDLLLGKS